MDRPVKKSPSPHRKLCAGLSTFTTKSGIPGLSSDCVFQGQKAHFPVMPVCRARLKGKDFLERSYKTTWFDYMTESMPAEWEKTEAEKTDEQAEEEAAHEDKEEEKPVEENNDHNNAHKEVTDDNLQEEVKVQVVVSEKETSVQVPSKTTKEEEKGEAKKDVEEEVEEEVKKDVEEERNEEAKKAAKEELKEKEKEPVEKERQPQPSPTKEPNIGDGCSQKEEGEEIEVANSMTPDAFKGNASKCSLQIYVNSKRCTRRLRGELAESNALKHEGTVKSLIWSTADETDLVNM